MRACRHLITGDRLRMAGGAAAKQALQKLSLALNREHADGDGVVQCIYEGTAEDGEQLNWDTPVNFKWTFEGVEGDFGLRVAAGRALHKRLLPLPRPMKAPLLAAYLPRLLTEKRVLSCMAKQANSRCRCVALPRTELHDVETVKLLTEGQPKEYIVGAHVSAQHYIVHPIGGQRSPKRLFKTLVPTDAPKGVYAWGDRKGLNVVVSAATFLAEKEKARDEQRPMSFDVALRLLDVSPWSWDKSTKEFFVLWSSEVEGQGVTEHIVQTNLHTVLRRLQAQPQ